MAGVAGPMFSSSPGRGARFLAALAAGGVFGSLLLSLPIYLLAALMAELLPYGQRIYVVIGIGLLLGLIDLLNKTPHVWRQVPQRYARSLADVPLGLVWGTDLGLLVTTQKTTSLLWASIAAVTLLHPAATPFAVAVISLFATVGIVVLTVSRVGARISGPNPRARLPWIRRAAGSLLILASVAMLIQVAG